MPGFVHVKVSRRGRCGRFWLGPPPNQHESLFWFDRKGAAFLTAFIQISLLLTAIYLSIFGVYYANLILEVSPHWAATAAMFIGAPRLAVHRCCVMG